MHNAPQYFDGPNGRIAYRRRNCSSSKPGVIWLGGFRSDMLGTKACYLDDWAVKNKRPFMRFDYSGHGESEGKFEDGSIGEWAADALTAFDTLTKGRQVLIGSSMGAWITTLIATQRPDRVAGIIFIAPAPDFTEKLMWPSFTDEQRQKILNEGKLELPSDYSDEPEIFTRKLIEDGRQHLVMTGPISIHCPVRILQGMQDDAVPWRHAINFSALLATDNVEITLTKRGDHRLSTPEDLIRLTRAVESI